MTNPYTIHPCRYDSPERDHIERCEPEEAEFWSLYKLDTEGLERIVCDLPTKLDADKIKLELDSLAGALSVLAEDCRMALDDEWDRSDAGFEDMLTLISSVIPGGDGGITILQWAAANPEAAEALLKGEAAIVPLAMKGSPIDTVSYHTSLCDSEVTASFMGYGLNDVRLDRPQGGRDE